MRSLLVASLLCVGLVCTAAAQTQDTPTNAPAATPCAPGNELVGELCYPKCQDGYQPDGVLCKQICPERTQDTGAHCLSGPAQFRKKFYERAPAQS